MQGAITLLEAVHGEHCRQLESLENSANMIEKEAGNEFLRQKAIYARAQGALRNLKDEIEGGIIGSMTRTIAGEVMGDLVLLAKEHLGREGDGEKNVAAVLAAAAFEDTIRRMGLLFAGIVDRVELPKILAELKSRGVLPGSQVGVVQAHFQFRNDALHADWTKIDRVAVGTAIHLFKNFC